MSEALDGDASSPLRTLLPFRVNGSLQGEERRRLDAAMAADPALAEEARALAQLRRNIQDLPAPASPGEFGLARLLRDLDRGADLPPSASRAAVWPVRMAALAAVIIGVGLGFLFWPHHSGDGTPGYGTPGYRQASVRSGAAMLSVTFEPAVSQAALTQLLLAHDLRIVDGPSALGIYRLALPDAADRRPVIEALQAAGDLVESVSVSE